MIKLEPGTQLRLLFAIILSLGILFRFADLERKVYYGDEAYSSLRVSGYTEAELIQQFSYDRLFGIEDLQKYQRPTPEKELIDTTKSLATEEPQHPPLYFMMVRLWNQWFGSSIAVTRSLSALISLLVFPCIYWLSRELFDSVLVGCVAIVLVAVSPLHVLFAQEVREYVFWTVTILVSSASLLQAMRLQTKLSWAMYTATTVLGLYTFTFSALVVAGHGAYVFAIERCRLSKTVIAYLLASLAGFLGFAPWAWVIATGLPQVDKTAGFARQLRGSLYVIRTIMGNIRLAFFDLNSDPHFPSLYFSSFGIYPYLNVAILILVGYSIYLLCWKTPKPVWLFIVTLVGVPLLALVILQKSDLPRYFIPCYLGIQLAVAYLIANQIVAASFRNTWRQRLWQILVIALISGGVLSCVVSSQTETWWIKGNSYDRTWARVINQSPHPLLIGDIPVGDLLTFSHYLDPKVRLQIEPRCYTCPVKSPLAAKHANTPKVPDGFSDLFLFWPSKELQDRLEKEYKIEPVQELNNLQRHLWRLEKY